MKLDSENQQRVRRAVMRLISGADGESVTIRYLGADPGLLRAEVISFALARSTGIKIESVELGLKVTRDDSCVIGPQRWAILDTLAVGEQHVFALPAMHHARVRAAASFRLRVGLHFTCKSDADTITVTRVEATEEVREPAVRVSKYGLDRLAAVDRVHFDVGPADYQKVRAAVHIKRVATGWDLASRVQKEGGVTVFRLDPIAPQTPVPAPAPAPAAEAEAVLVDPSPGAGLEDDSWVAEGA